MPFQMRSIETNHVTRNYFSISVQHKRLLLRSGIRTRVCSVNTYTHDLFSNLKYKHFTTVLLLSIVVGTIPTK